MSAADQLTHSELMMSFSRAIQSELGLCVLGSLESQASVLQDLIEQRSHSLDFESVFVLRNSNNFTEEIGLSISFQSVEPYKGRFTLFVDIHNCEG